MGETALKGMEEEAMRQMNRGRGQVALTVRRETVRQLSSAALAQVGGASELIPYDGEAEVQVAAPSDLCGSVVRSAATSGHCGTGGIIQISW
jgi:hypothetical protein